MDLPLAIALIGAMAAAVGWVVNHIFTSVREERVRHSQAALKFVERQLEELYGPLVFLLCEGRQTFEDLLDSLGRRHVFTRGEDLAPDELKTWLFWAEHSFFPKNARIQQLLMAKAHLIDGDEFPQSHVDFLNHHNSWAINHARWKEEGIKYSWHSKVNYPIHFEHDVIATFAALKKRHAALLGKLSN